MRKSVKAEIAGITATAMTVALADQQQQLPAANNGNGDHEGNNGSEDPEGVVPEASVSASSSAQSTPVHLMR